MSASKARLNRIREQRIARGWSQEELAKRSGISRTGISAIEGDRLVPSVVTAIKLARLFECSAEELFAAVETGAARPGTWAWLPSRFPCRYWSAEIRGMVLRYPVESSAAGMMVHDGTALNAAETSRSSIEAKRTLVVACCDPAISLLVQEYSRQTPFRMLVFTRSSQESLSLVQQGLVHVAGVHLAQATESSGNAAAIRRLCTDQQMQLLHIGCWQEGLALGTDLQVSAARQVVAKRLRWIGRPTGTGARRWQDEVLGARKAPQRTAADHRGIVEAIRNGWADVGVCLQLTCDEGQLGFLPLGEDSYDLCFSQNVAHDPRVIALIEVVRSRIYRALLADLPGYRLEHCGEIEEVNT